MKSVSIALILLLVLGLTCIAQNRPDDKHGFSGVVRDQNNLIIPGLRLDFKDGAKTRSTFTDINGEFTITLESGHYEITADPIPSSDFKLFLKISEGPLNPARLEIKVNSTNICANWSKVTPAIRSYMLPPYPPAAKAVRANGEVVIKVEIDSSGNVRGTESLRGHPLLRAASKIAAERTTFNAADSDQKRSAELTYVYLVPEETKYSNNRLFLPCRLVINTEPIRIY